jgi:hypothetical protein
MRLVVRSDYTYGNLKDLKPGEAIPFKAANDPAGDIRGYFIACPRCGGPTSFGRGDKFDTQISGPPDAPTILPAHACGFGACGARYYVEGGEIILA